MKSRRSILLQASTFGFSIFLGTPLLKLGLSAQGLGRATHSSGPVLLKLVLTSRVKGKPLPDLDQKFIVKYSLDSERIRMKSSGELLSFSIKSNFDSKEFHYLFSSHQALQDFFKRNPRPLALREIQSLDLDAHLNVNGRIFDFQFLAAAKEVSCFFT